MLIRSLVGLAVFISVAPVSAQNVDFNRDVRPILSGRCFHCHGPDANDRKAGLRLDTPEGAARVLKGKTGDATKLVRRITSTDVDERMPPPDANFSKALTPKEIATLKAWVASGAKYAKHWAFEPIAAPTPPNVADAAWQAPIDRFLRARLEAVGLTPLPEADRVTLLRRVTFDLTGLPPTPAEVDAFVRDESPTAYDKVVDRLFKSPHYGERMAVAWLDLARYGDSSCYHGDGHRDMWAYRDWVINAFNDDMPFDRFVVDQVAGDLEPRATTAQKVASAFNRNNATTDEGGAIPEEYRIEYAVDRVKTTANAFLALSMECAQCHDHKYDPISNQEYYRFFAYFNNTKDPGMQTRTGNTAPLAQVIDPNAAQKLPIAKAAREKAVAAVAKHRHDAVSSKAYKTWLAFQKPDAKPLSTDVAFYLPLTEKGSTVLGSADGQFAGSRSANPLEDAKRPGGIKLANLLFNFERRFDPDQPFTIAVWAKVAQGGGGTILSSIAEKDNVERGFELIVGSKPSLRFLQGESKGLIVSSETEVKMGVWTRIVCRYDGSGKAAGVRFDLDDKQAEVRIVRDKLEGPAKVDAPLVFGGRKNDRAFLGDLDGLCVYSGRLTDDEMPSALDPVAGAIANPKRSKALEAVVLDRYLRTADAGYAKLLKTARAKFDEERKVGDGITSVMIMEDMPAGQMRPTYILRRGQYDQPDKAHKVTPGVPASLPAMPKDAPANRLGLAQWIVSPDQPLTARVAVNRLWIVAFGEGLVRTSEDFGLQGEMPSHPELLDWLASDFVKHGWDVKRTMRMLVTSEAYKQSAKATAKAREIDPENRLLSRGPRMRLQGEFVRDNALFVSGLLVDKIGGPSVKPYQPPRVWEEVTISGEGYVPDHGDKNYRRSMYTYWKRSAPHPAMIVFDAPSREKCVGNRPRTNTPLQALVTLNDPQFVEAARAFAERIVKSSASRDERIDFAIRNALGRPATSRERDLLGRLVETETERFKADPKRAESLLKIGESPRDASIPVVEHASWTVLANTVMNLDEFLVK
jgi:Protein of unknown function (DUF1553)/Protein of unknown function (DUF1549)/Planctomycete cytochrome C/Concanavalin A-like lectin/glucanases superfamily